MHLPQTRTRSTRFAPNRSTDRGDRVVREGETDALVVSALSVRFGGISALDGVSLTVRSGEICGLIGANGAGKTTLFDVISGVRVPDEGRVQLHGRDVTRASPQRRARAGLRRTFQRVQVFGWLSVEDNLLAATEWRGGGGGVLADLIASPTRRRREFDRRQRASAVLERCGLSSIADMPASGLPIGTSRLVELGRALVDEPSVLLLDEPASGLDAREAERFASLVRSTRDEFGTAVLLVEHDVGFVLANCDRVVVLHLGRVLAEGSPDEIRDDPAVREAYLGAASTS
ncbi:MAG: ABC transporter ATP-binding protein [Acidimicrobiales bacterium]|nr:ABC transporter ATP-binding protein [Acidimicrobiales bacterium]